MAQYLFRRFLSMISVLIIVSVITFIVMHSIPGGPFDREKPLPQRTVDQLNAKYRLDEPLWAQYLYYMSDIVVPRITPSRQSRSVQEDYLINVPLPGGESTLRWMNFGPTYRSRGRSVNSIFQDTLPVSMQLGVAAMLVALAIGIPAGIVAGLKRNTIYDYASMSIAIVGVSVPVIVSGPVLRYLFGVQLKWLPPTGWGGIEYVIMPAFALGFAQSALLARLTRASLLQVMDEDYIRTARAKGLSERVVVTLHAMKNAMIPVVTVIGPLFAFLITGSFVAELIFGIPGLGQYFVNSISNRDYPVIMGTTLLFAFFIVLANLFVDIVYVWIDPRIKYS